MDIRLNQYQPITANVNTPRAAVRGTQSTEPVEAISKTRAIENLSVKLEDKTEAQRIANNGNGPRGQVIDIFV